MKSKHVEVALAEVERQLASIVGEDLLEMMNWRDVGGGEE